MEVEKVLLTTKINSNGRIYLKKSIREMIGLKEGDELSISLTKDKNGILLEGVEW